MIGKIFVIIFAVVTINLSGCSKLVVPDESKNLNVDDFEYTWTTVQQEYPFLQFKKINWDSLHIVYRSKAERAKGDEIFFILSELLAELKDGHVALLSRGGGVPTIPYWPPRVVRDRSLYKPEVIRNYLDLKLTGENNIEYGITPDNIGYVYIGTFSEGSGPWAYSIDAALDELRNAKGLILDVRNNGGGSTNTSDVIIARFLKNQQPSPPCYIHGQQVQPYYIYPRGPFQWTKPTVVLINGTSFSCADFFPEILKQLPFVTAIGDTTGGGGGAYQYYTLPSGTKVRMPFKEFRRYDNVEVEWNGVPPDIYVKQHSDHLSNGIDDQLEYAFHYLQ